MKKRICLLVLLLMCFAGCAQAAIGTLTLPQELTFIEEEAFYQVQEITTAVVPEGTVSIGERAFAQSGLKEIILPTTLTSIADSAFDGVESLTVHAVQGTPAFTWAVEKGYLPNDETAFAVSVSASAAEAAVNDTVTWTASSLNALGGAQYRFELYCNRVLIAQTDYSAETVFSHTFTRSGQYQLIVRGKDGNASVSSVQEARTVEMKPLVVHSVTAQGSPAVLGDLLQWNVSASGGAYPYAYQFEVLRGGETVFESIQSDSAFYYTPSIAGSYSLKVTVKESTGTSADALAAAVSIARPAETPAGDFTYKTFPQDWGYPMDGVIITAYNGTNSHVVVPEKIDGMTVIAVQITNNTAIETIVLPQGIAHASKFYTDSMKLSGCTNLQQIVIPEGVTELKYGTFHNMTKLVSITLPDSITSMPSYAFEGCASLVNVHLPESLTAVPVYAFIGCSNLKTVNIPVSALTIGSNAFEDCTSLAGELILPEGMTEIKSNAFDSCTSLKGVSLPNTLTVIGNNAFRDCASLKSIDIPDGVATIGEYAFAGCSSLSAAALPKNLQKIGCHAFSNCSSLEEIEIPDSVTAIGYDAFYNCTSLRRAVLPEGLTTIPNSLFNYCSSLRSVNIPSSVTAIGEHAFYHCSQLTGLSLPENLTSIGQYAFAWSNGFSGALNIPKTVMSIGQCAFNSCKGLTSVVIPEGITELDYNTFSDCSGLKQVVLPNSLTNLEHGVFNYCTSLESIVISDNLTDLDSMAFYHANENAVYYCSAGSAGASTLSAQYQKFVDPAQPDYQLLQLKDDSGKLFLKIMKYIGSSSELTIPAKIGLVPVKALENHFAYDSDDVQSVYLPDTLTEIGINASSHPSGFTLYANLGTQTATALTASKSAGYNAFLDPDIEDYQYWQFEDENGNLTLTLDKYLGSESEVTVPASAEGIPVTAIFNYAFRNLSITSVVVPEGIVSIGDTAFGGCTSLQSVSLPEGLISIGSSAFSGCSALAQITLPQSLTTLGNAVFRECPLTSIVIPPLVTDIPYRTFYYCSNLTEITLPENLTAIGQEAFYTLSGSNCELFLPNHITTIDKWAFASRFALKCNPGTTTAETLTAKGYSFTTTPIVE